MKPEHLPIIALGTGLLLIVLSERRYDLASPLGVAISLLMISV